MIWQFSKFVKYLANNWQDRKKTWQSRWLLTNAMMKDFLSSGNYTSIFKLPFSHRDDLARQKKSWQSRWLLTNAMTNDLFPLVASLSKTNILKFSFSHRDDLARQKKNLAKQMALWWMCWQSVWFLLVWNEELKTCCSFS